MFILIFLAVVLLVLSAYLRSPAGKGKLGELFVSLGLKLMLDKTAYHIVNNVTIPDDHGGTTQIDHIIVSRFGIFVIETKNMQGWIFGEKNSALWTQTIYKVRNSFQNPVRQNYKHVMCLAQLLDLPVENFHQCIIFIGDCTLKTRDKLPPWVTTGGLSMVNFIRSKQEVCFDDDQLTELVQDIEEGRLSRTLRTNREHVAHVKGIIERRSTPAHPPIPNPPETDNTQPRFPPKPSSAPNRIAPLCPNCGMAMVRRIAKRGPNAGNPFWGCSNYPKCKSMVFDE